MRFSAPAGDRPATTDTVINGVRAAILPNGRLVTPAGVEVSVDAPKPYGTGALAGRHDARDDQQRRGPFSLTAHPQPHARHAYRHADRRQSTFMGVAFSRGRLALLSRPGARTATSGSATPSPPDHRIGQSERPDCIRCRSPARRRDDIRRPLQGTFPGNVALARTTDATSTSSTRAASTSPSSTRPDHDGSRCHRDRLLEPNNFAAVVGRVKAGRYPVCGGPTSPDGQVTARGHVGVFEVHAPAAGRPTGDRQPRLPARLSGAGYPKRDPATIASSGSRRSIPRNLPDALRDPEGSASATSTSDIDSTVPGLGSPERSRVLIGLYVLDVSNPDRALALETS